MFKKLLASLKIHLPTRAELIDTAKRSVVTFVSSFVPAFSAALSATNAPVTLALLGSLALSSAAAAVNVVYRLIWKPKLVEYVPVVTPPESLLPEAPPAPVVPPTATGT